MVGPSQQRAVRDVLDCVRRGASGRDDLRRLGADVLLRVSLRRQVRDFFGGPVRRRRHRSVSELHAADQGHFQRERSPRAAAGGGRGAGAGRGRGRAKERVLRCGAGPCAGAGVKPSCVMASMSYL